MKYFLTQTIASILLITRIFLIFNQKNFINNILLSALILKIGVAPFHQWIPAISEGLNWETILILLIPQKVGPLILIHQTTLISYIDFKIILFIIITTLVGRIGGLINFSLRKIIVYSSISHSGWILARILFRIELWLRYFIIYSIILSIIILLFIQIKTNNLKQVFSINNIIVKFLLIIIFLSLRGLPPFRGFLAKYLVILIILKRSFKLILIPIILSTLIRLFFYIRIVVINMITNNKPYYLTKPKRRNKKIIIINTIGLLGGWFFFILLDFKLNKLKDFKS